MQDNEIFCDIDTVRYFWIYLWMFVSIDLEQNKEIILLQLFPQFIFKKSSTQKYSLSFIFMLLIISTDNT